MERIGEGSGCGLISGTIQPFAWGEWGKVQKHQSKFNFQEQSWRCNFLLYSQAAGVLSRHFFVNNTSTACFNLIRSSSGRCFYITVALYCIKSSTCFTLWEKAHSSHWTGHYGEEKNLAHVRNQTSPHPAHSLSLYWLSYPGSPHKHIRSKSSLIWSNGGGNHLDWAIFWIHEAKGSPKRQKTQIHGKVNDISSAHENN
jgi:hypothetical protein